MKERDFCIVCVVFGELEAGGREGGLREVPLAQNQAVQSKPYLLYFCLSLLFSAFTDKRKGAKAMEALTCSCNTILSHSPVDP